MVEATSLGGRVDRWVRTTFAGKPTVSSAELTAEASTSGLPAEALDAIRQLPPGTWTVDDAVHLIVDVLETRSGGGARGNANLPGRGGYGR